MRTSKRKLNAMQTVISRGPDRSSLFWWMVDNHASLLAKGSRGRMPWKTLCVDFAADGLVDGSGKPATELRASRTWREACDEVRRRPPANATAPGQRSRPEGSWSPPTVPVAEPSGHAVGPIQSLRPVERPPSLTGTSPVSRPPLDQDPSVEDQFAEVRRQFAAQDRKRFGSM